MMNDRGKSDRSIVAEKVPNNADRHAAEAAEERGRAKGNPPKHDKRWTPSQGSLPMGLERVRLAAAQDRKQRFTALLQVRMFVRLFRVTSIPLECPSTVPRCMRSVIR